MQSSISGTSQGGPAVGVCPVVQGFNPIDAEASQEDLLVGWRRARAEAPVFYVPEHGYWCVGTYDLMEEVLRDPQTFSNAAMGEVGVPVPPEYRDDLPEGWPVEQTLTSMDPPEHTRVRRLAQPAFTKRVAVARSEDIRRVCNELIDEFVALGEVDLAAEYTRRIPLRIVPPILGVPEQDAEQLYTWAMEALLLTNNDAAMSEDFVRRIGASQAAYARYAQELIDERRRHPRGENDMLTRIIFAESEGDAALSQSEVLGIVLGILIAGIDTTATAMGNALHALLVEPDRWARVVADHDLIDTAAEEGLRMRPPFNAIHRLTTRDCEIGGVSIPRGAIVQLSVLSGGRDPEKFDDPDRFVLDRPNADRHFAFGKLTHFCLGSPLARVEMRIGIETLADRIPGLRLSRRGELHYMPSTMMRVLLDGLLAEWN